jgi:asparagine N-glycosylation enzyme membrane subunit Stt3
LALGDASADPAVGFIAPAILGVAAIPLMFMACSLMYGRTTAVFAALLLLAMTWHLHLSRMGFMVIGWPMMEVLTLWALWLAFKRRSLWLYALAGLCLGLGVYTYNAYLLFVPVPFVALALLSMSIFPLPVLMTPLQIGRLTFPTLGSAGLFFGSPGSLVWAILSVFVLFVLMVFRGLLFRSLANSTRRQRVFRSRYS